LTGCPIASGTGDARTAPVLDPDPTSGAVTSVSRQPTSSRPRDVPASVPTRRGRVPTARTQEKIVAANCDVCAKGPSFGHSISHSHVRTKRRWNPNIQRVRAVVAGTPKRINVCTSCLKAGKVQRAV